MVDKRAASFQHQSFELNDVVNSFVGATNYKHIFLRKSRTIMRTICAAVIEAIDEISDSANMRELSVGIRHLHCDINFLEQFYVVTLIRISKNRSLSFLLCDVHIP